MKRSGLIISMTLAVLFSLMVSNVLADKVLIGFAQQPGPAEEALVRGAGGAIKYTFHIVPAIAADVPGQVIAQLRANRMVAHVHPDGRVQALDAELDNSWGVKRIGTGTVHDSGNKGTGVKVAILDTGIDKTHSDLDANYAGGKSFVDYTLDPMDDNGHGTHVAGIVAAEDNEAGVVGVAPEAELYAFKVLDAGGSGWWSDIIAAIEWSVDNGMQVINMSLGGSSDLPDVETACQAANSAGILLVAAAGNSGNPPGRGDNIGYPAGYASVIAVAATDQNDQRAKWSSTGAALELSAPGVSVNSTLLGGGYGTKSGTSMASPHVAGVAALVWVANPTWTNNEVRYQLQITADDLGNLGWDSKYGHGLVDADEAAGVLPNNPPAVSIISPVDGSTFASGATILFEGTAQDVEDGDLTASMLWASDIDGQIGTGGSFSATLSDGQHTITASVTDSGEATGSNSIAITVGIPSEPTTVSVSSISYSTIGGGKHLLITIALVDNLNSPVADASVSIDVSLNGTSYGSWTGTTGAEGTVTFKLTHAPSGTYTTTVTNVTAEGLTWDGITPDNGFSISNSKDKTVLMQNTPNPFNPETWIPYRLTEGVEVTITIYNVGGQLIRTLDVGYQNPGSYISRSRAAYWDGRSETGENVSSGVYFYRIQAGDFSAIRKMLVVR